MIHCAIDGYSRMVTFLKCSSNNKASTVLEEFINAISSFGCPLKIRTDHGTENVLVARFMLETRGVSGSPVITGKSVHNQRIERLWVDVFVYVSQLFWNIFHYLELEHEIDSCIDIHLFCLHFVYIPRINQMLKEFARSWNMHGIRTEGNRSPFEIWTAGYYEGMRVETNWKI